MLRGNGSTAQIKNLSKIVFDDVGAAWIGLFCFKLKIVFLLKFNRRVIEIQTITINICAQGFIGML